jgi:hypothetical protein
MKQKDFVTLDDSIKANYEMRLKEHETFIAQIAKEQQEAQSGFIPSGGALAKADLYVNPDPSNPLKTQRAVFPTEALQWLKKRLDDQGSTQDLLATIQNAGAIGDISKMLPAPQQQAGNQAQLLQQDQQNQQNQQEMPQETGMLPQGEY